MRAQFVTRLIALDRARLRQANRLFSGTNRSLSKTDLITLEAEDILASRVFLESTLDNESKTKNKK